MRNTKSLAMLVTAICTAAAAVTGCSSSPSADRAPDWTKASVAGSRIARRLDSFGNPATGTLVQVITDENLKLMPGNSLVDKLSGNPGGI
jgi:hypothetical protein